MSLARLTLVRLLRIHQAIGTGGYPSLERLAQMCEVHSRTVKRDLRVLREEFRAPLAYCSQHRGYHYEREFSLVPAPFHERELLALSIAIEVANTFRNTPFAEAVHKALGKLQLMLPPSERVSGLSESIAFVPDPTPPEQLSTIIHFNSLLEAIDAHRQVRLIYHTASSGMKTERVVDPYQLYLHHGVWYLHGLCHLREERRDFAVHRILHLETLPSTFAPPDPKQIRDELARRFTIVQDAPMDVQVWFDAQTAPFIKEFVWHKSQAVTDHPDGSCTLAMRVEGFSSVLRWVLGFGHHAVALAPPDLVREVRAEARQMAAPRKLPKGCVPAG